MSQNSQPNSPKNIFKKLYNNPLSQDNLCSFLNLSQEELQIEFEILKAKGFPIEKKDDLFILSTQFTEISNQKFCFVDIETTGAKPADSQVIEIGALIYQNGEIVESFEEFIHAPFIPEVITNLTQITTQMLQDSRKECEVLKDFKEFLGDSVFVAHNVGFDYGFLSYALEKNNLGELLNPKLCTIDLARRTILSKRYSLQYLNEFLGINTTIAHRAYADALTALEIFKISMLCLPRHIKTTQDLIEFSKSKSAPIPKIKES